MRHQLLLLLLLAACQVSAQTYHFLPAWKKGETKTATTVVTESELKKGEKTDTSFQLQTIFTVVDDQADSYTLQVLNENVAMRTAAAFYDKMGEELPQYKTLELRYRIDKKTGKAELLNWEDARKFILASFEQISSLMQSKVPEIAEFSNTIFGPVLKMFDSKENIEAYMKDEIGYFLFPYDKTFVQGDTLRITDQCANPFNPLDTINQLTLAWLSDVNSSLKTCNIHYRELLDLAEFKKMMLAMMEKMSKSFGASDSDQTQAAKEIESMQMDMSRETVISFDYNSTWPVQVVKSARVTMNMPGSKSEKTVTARITFK